MIKLQKIYLLALVTLNLFFLAKGMEQATKSNFYKDKEITAENLFDLSVKPSPELLNKVIAWYIIPENKTVVEDLLAMPTCKTLEELKAAIKQKAEYMSSNNLKNLSKYNYIFNPKDKDFTIRISGIINVIRTRIAGILHINPWSKESLGDFDLEKATSSDEPIFQHVSCAAYYLRLSELEPFLKHIHLVPTYLLPLTDKTKQLCSDKDFIIIQTLLIIKKSLNYAHLLMKKKQEILQNLPDQAIKELYLTIRYAALWDIHNNVMVDLQHPQQLWIADFEQPNNSDARYFFYHGQEGFDKYMNDYNCGLGYIRELLQKFAPEKYELWQSVAAQDWNSFFQSMTNN